jgi:hypothetical protein
MFYGVSEIVDLLKVAIQQRTTTELQHGTEDNNLKMSIRDQQEICWSHILFGRFELTGERWTQIMTQNIWDTFLSLWNNRNTIMYEDQNKSNHDILKERLRMRVENCYLYADKLRKRLNE